MGGSDPGPAGERRGKHSAVDADPRSTAQIREDALGAYHDARQALALRTFMCGHKEWDLIAECRGCGRLVYDEVAQRVLGLD